MNNQRLDLIRERITSTLSPTFLEIKDDSVKHLGHEGAKTGRGHFAITISSPQFENKTLLQCHRLIYSALDRLIDEEIHALKIKIIRREQSK